jgi:glycerol-3-phosphate cytidylyltransferase
VGNTDKKGLVTVRRVITYGTFDLFHIGHLNLLRRARELGDYLVVAVSTDEFNAGKHKQCVYPYEHRASIVEAITYVDMVIPETSWEQKTEDVRNFGIDVFVIGEDWKGEFDFLKELCEVVYLSRTEYISTTHIKNQLQNGKTSL